MPACRQVTEICNVEPHPQDRTNVLTLTSSRNSHVYTTSCHFFNHSHLEIPYLYYMTKTFRYPHSVGPIITQNSNIKTLQHPYTLTSSLSCVIFLISKTAPAIWSAKSIYNTSIIFKWPFWFAWLDQQNRVLIYCHRIWE